MTSTPDVSKRIVPTADLIKVIKDKRCLWDRTSLSYKDRTKRDKAWKEVYKAFELNFDDLLESEQNEIGMQITKKWYNIRDAYAKSCKNVKIKRPYVYSELLSFLDPIYFDQNQSESEHNNSNDYRNDEDSNSVEDIEDSSSRHFQEEVYLEVEDDIFEPPTKKSKIVNTSPTVVNTQRRIHATEQDHIVSLLGNLIEREEDEDTSFFRSIMSSVKSLSEDLKFEFRINVLKLIQTLKNNDKNRINVKNEITRIYSDHDVA